MLLCLAASYAEAGKSFRAAATASQAADLARDAGNEPLESTIRQLAGMYAQGKTYRDYARRVQRTHEGQ